MYAEVCCMQQDAYTNTHVHRWARTPSSCIGLVSLEKQTFLRKAESSATGFDIGHRQVIAVT